MSSSYSSAPKLTQTTARENIYAPVSWLAVLAALVALVFLIIMIVFAVGSFLKKQHLLEQWLLIFPAVALAIAFAGYHHVKNSEGTRTDRLLNINLISFAVLSSLLGGAGFIAYLTAVEFSVRQDAENEFNAWSNLFKQLNANDPSGKDFAPIVHKTLEPSAQKNVAATDAQKIQMAYADLYLVLSQSDVARIAMRNPGAIEFKPQGLAEWSREKDSIQCKLTSELISPEGTFMLSMKMLASIAPNGSRSWAIENKPSYVDGGQVTDYGQKVIEIESAGRLFAMNFLNMIDTTSRAYDPAQKDLLRSLVYTDFMSKPFQSTQTSLGLTKYQSAVLMGGLVLNDIFVPDYETKIANEFFMPVLPETGLSPDERTKKEKELRDQFVQSWNQSRITRPGTRIQQTKDTMPILTFDDKKITVSFPFEIPLNQNDTTRGRLYCECVDPKAVKELNDLKANAKPGVFSNRQTKMEIPSLAWRIAGFRSDMKVAFVPKQQPQQGGPGMGE